MKYVLELAVISSVPEIEQEGNEREECQVELDKNPNTCIFCSKLAARSPRIRQYGTICALEDSFPVSEGHLLVIPLRHTGDIYEMTNEEAGDLARALKELKAQLLDSDASIAGFTIGANVGEAAGQTVFHAHVHLIPRRHGDTADPTGGIRCVIPERKYR